MQTQQHLFKLAFNYGRLIRRRRVYLFTSDYSRKNQPVGTETLCSSEWRGRCPHFRADGEQAASPSRAAHLQLLIIALYVLEPRSSK